jgi:hypothetical protein
MDLEMHPFEIEIDANRADEGEHWRIYRIHRIVGYAQALADADNNEDYYKKIKSIYERKGHLTITWITEPSKCEEEYLQKAWESIVTDYEGNPIEHEL